MNLFEFQGKELFKQAGIAVPESRLFPVFEADGREVDLAILLNSLNEAADELSAGHSAGHSAGTVLKAQLDMGGRGKAGLIEFIPAGGSVSAAAKRILGKGFRIPALLLERAVDFTQELYLSISVDPVSATYTVLASARGGVDIETLAAEDPGAIRRLTLDPFRGLQAFQSRSLAFSLSVNEVRGFSSLLWQVCDLFMDKDAELVEINPLFITTGGGFVAGDAKVIIDDNSLGRHSEFIRSRDQYDSDIAFEAACAGIPYLQFDGNISLMCAGAGLTTTVFDLVNDEGGSVANYLEFGGPNYHRAEQAMELCLKNESDVILLVTFGTIARADVMAEGLVSAIDALKPDRPIITCIRGTNEEEADKTLRRAGLEPLYDMEEAVRKAVNLAGGKQRGEGGA